MSLYYRSLIEQGKLLDIYPNAAVAYSLRKLREGYTGSAIRVRIEFDNAEQDIGFDSTGGLDADAIVNFFGNNLLLQSENFNTTWSKSQTTITTGAILGPNGVDMADKLEETATTGTHTINQAFGSATLNVGADYFFSIYLKESERNIVDIVSGIEGTTKVLRVNLTSGTVVFNSFINSPTIIDAGNGWWKVEIISTSTVSSVPTGFQIRLTDGSTQSYLGTLGFGCFIWGAQVSGYTGTPVPYFKTTTIRAGNAFIRTWYDQSGNGRNADQLIPTNQAQIVSNGSLIMIGSKITTNWTNDSYNISAFSTTVPIVSTYVARRNGTGTSGAMSSFSNAGSTVAAVFRWVSNNSMTTYLNTPRTHSPSNTFTGDYLLTTYKRTDNFTNIRRNNVEFASGGISTGNGTINSFGSANGSRTTGNVNEAILWYQDYVSLIPEIETKINEYYAIY
jgi:hypothetical protein